MNAVERIVLCRAVENHEPVEVTSTFRPEDTIFVHFSMGAPGDYEFRISMRKAGRISREYHQELRTQKTWTRAYTRFDLTRVPHAVGTWDMAITLVLGGARSGKSTYAEKIALSACSSPVYLATARAGDEVSVRATPPPQETFPTGPDDHPQSGSRQ